jgi:Holliday junction resolvase
MKTYEKGRRLEYEVRDYLKQKSYFVVRQAKSSFPDIIAYDPRSGNLFGVECRWNKYLSSREISSFKELKRNYRLIPVRAYKIKEGKRKILVFETLLRGIKWVEIDM